MCVLLKSQLNLCGGILSTYDILVYKVVRFFGLKLKISETTEPIGFSILKKLHIGLWMVLGYITILVLNRGMDLGYFLPYLYHTCKQSP